MHPADELKNGVSILNPIMTSHGFRFVVGSSGNGSGGEFASGYYENGNRRLCFSVRYNLGCVCYQIDEKEINHSEYMRVIGINGEYPGFSKQTSDAFVHLANDIEKHASVFLGGTDHDFRQIIQLAKSNPKKKGFGALP